MNTTTHLARHLRALHFGPNWTSVSLKEALADVTWQQAVARVNDCNTIVALVYHINYFVDAVLKVLRGGPLDAHDKYSFDHPPIASPDDWQRLLDKVWTDAEALTKLVEQLPEARLSETFVDEKYGDYFANLQGLIEHSNYHLGQIVLLKKLLVEEERG
jgi:hypothetical protein